MAVEATFSSLAGLWQPQSHLKNLFYGPSCVEENLLTTLPSSTSKAFIITGTSLSTQDPLVRRLETQLGEHHAGTFAGIQQHGPVASVDAATSLIADKGEIDSLISLGGDSPIDAAKTISHRINQTPGHYLTHIAIPTTLSAADCTAGGGYTRADGTKVGFMSPGMGVSSIFYDPGFARYTPKRLWLATGMRAVDHAVETFYHPFATEMPWKAMAAWALGILVTGLRAAKDNFPGHDEGAITRLLLAAFPSSALRGANVKGGMGLSHALGYALGSPYGIPHGETSCLTLGAVVMLKAESPAAAEQIARLLSATGGIATGDLREDARQVGKKIDELVESLGLHQTLTEKGVGKDQIHIIAQRALGGVTDGPLYDDVANLVERLY